MSRSRKPSGIRWRAPLAVLVVIAAAHPAHAQESLAVAVKAAYLAKIAPFIDWPAAAMGGPHDPLVICIVGPDPFHSILDRAIAGQTADGHPIVVRRLARVSTSSGCHIAFLGWPAGGPLKVALSSLQGAPVLTVTDEATPRGMVDFTLADGRVRFRIDAAAAARSGLGVSSKLLGLALSVEITPAAEQKP